MNRLVLIGNGFDLAHGLKTSYADFINWYWEEWGKRLMVSGEKSESDEFCRFILNAELGFGAWYLVRDWYFQNINLDAKSFIERAKKDRTLCELLYNDTFFVLINNSIETKKWVDLEDEYYNLLLELLGVNTTQKIWLKPKALNDDLDSLKNKLIEYLKLESRSTTATIEDIRDKIYRPIKEKEIAVANKKLFEEEEDHKPTSIMLLNFNYTTTPERYVEGHSNVTINYIHGRLDDPESVIFGYGDELDENYKRLKEQNDSESMRHVKSIRYQEHDNYRRMLEFIESAPFQVVIMGHSCGNSDRTLLNTIFEHRNCVSIKPYYYQKDDKTDNYSELTININRNFNDPKLMRDRVVCKDYCEPLTNANNKPCTQPK